MVSPPRDLALPDRIRMRIVLSASARGFLPGATPHQNGIYSANSVKSSKNGFSAASKEKIVHVHVHVDVVVNVDVVVVVVVEVDVVVVVEVDVGRGRFFSCGYIALRLTGVLVIPRIVREH